jgi:hypothetical protein
MKGGLNILFRDDPACLNVGPLADSLPASLRPDPCTQSFT